MTGYLITYLAKKLGEIISTKGIYAPILSVFIWQK